MESVLGKVSLGLGILVSFCVFVSSNHINNDTAGTPRLLGFIIPGENGARPRLQLISGAQRFLGQGRRIAAAPLSRLRDIGVEGLPSAARSALRSVSFNPRSVVDAVRRVRPATRSGTSRGGSGRSSSGSRRRSNVMLVRPPSRTANAAGLTPDLLRQIRLALRRRGSARDATRGATRGSTRGDAAGTARGVPRGDTRSTARGVTRGVARGGVRGTTRGAARGVTRGDVRGTTRGAARGVARGSSRGFARDDSRSAVRVDSRGAIRGDVRGTARGVSRGDTRGDTRGVVRGVSRGDTRGDTRGVVRGAARVSPVSSRRSSSSSNSSSSSSSSSSARNVTSSGPRGVPRPVRPHTREELIAIIRSRMNAARARSTLAGGPSRVDQAVLTVGVRPAVTPETMRMESGTSSSSSSSSSAAQSDASTATLNRGQPASRTDTSSSSSSSSSARAESASANAGIGGVSTSGVVELVEKMGKVPIGTETMPVGPGAHINHVVPAPSAILEQPQQPVIMATQSALVVSRPTFPSSVLATGIVSAVPSPQALPDLAVVQPEVGVMASLPTSFPETGIRPDRQLASGIDASMSLRPTGAMETGIGRDLQFRSGIDAAAAGVISGAAQFAGLGTRIVAPTVVVPSPTIDAGPAFQVVNEVQPPTSFNTMSTDMVRGSSRGIQVDGVVPLPGSGTVNRPRQFTAIAGVVRQGEFTGPLDRTVAGLVDRSGVFTATTGMDRSRDFVATGRVDRPRDFTSTGTVDKQQVFPATGHVDKPRDFTATVPVDRTPVLKATGLVDRTPVLTDPGLVDRQRDFTHTGPVDRPRDFTASAPVGRSRDFSATGRVDRTPILTATGLVDRQRDLTVTGPVARPRNFTATGPVDIPREFAATGHVDRRRDFTAAGPVDRSSIITATGPVDRQHDFAAAGHVSIPREFTATGPLERARDIAATGPVDRQRGFTATGPLNRARYITSTGLVDRQLDFTATVPVDRPRHFTATGSADRPRDFTAAGTVNIVVPTVATSNRFESSNTSMEFGNSGAFNPLSGRGETGTMQPIVSINAATLPGISNAGVASEAAFSSPGVAPSSRSADVSMAMFPNPTTASFIASTNARAASAAGFSNGMVPAPNQPIGPITSSFDSAGVDWRLGSNTRLSGMQSTNSDIRLSNSFSSGMDNFGPSGTTVNAELSAGFGAGHDQGTGISGNTGTGRPDTFVMANSGSSNFAASPSVESMTSFGATSTREGRPGILTASQIGTDRLPTELPVPFDSKVRSGSTRILADMLSKQQSGATDTGAALRAVVEDVIKNMLAKTLFRNNKHGLGPDIGDIARSVLETRVAGLPTAKIVPAVPALSLLTAPTTVTAQGIATPNQFDSVHLHQVLGTIATLYPEVTTVPLPAAIQAAPATVQPVYIPATSATPTRHASNLIASDTAAASDVTRPPGWGVSIQTGTPVKGRFNEPLFKTIAVENKLFDVKQMKAASAKSAEARRMELLKGKQLIANGRSTSGASSMSVDRNMFSAPGLFDAAQTKGTSSNIIDSVSPNTINVGTSFLPIGSQATGSGITSDGSFLRSSLGSDSSRVSLSPSTKFHDQSSLLAMVSDQISKRRHHSTIPGPVPTATRFTRRPIFPTSSMPFTGPASAWDIRPKLPNTLDLIIPSHPTIAPSSGRVDIPPPPVHMVHPIQRQGTFLSPSTGLHLLTDMPFDEFRPHMTQKTVTAPKPGFDPLFGTGIFDVTVSLPQPRVDIITDDPYMVDPFNIAATTKYAVITTVPPPPSLSLNSGLHQRSIVQTVTNGLHQDASLQTIIAPNNTNFGGTSTGKFQENSFLFDPIAPTSQIYGDVSVDIGPPPPFYTIPRANPNIIQPAPNAFDPALDLTNKFDQPPSVISTEPAAYDTINTFDQRSQTLPPELPSTPISLHPALDSINTFNQTPRTAVLTTPPTEPPTHPAKPPTPPTEPPTHPAKPPPPPTEHFMAVHPSSDISTAPPNDVHVGHSLANSTSFIKNSESHVIQYDMTPFQNNENWAIFDPTSLPPGVNFSDFGPIIDLPIDTPVSFTSINEIGFQNMFSQDVPPDAGSLSANVTNSSSTGIGDIVGDMNAGIIDKPFIHTVEVIPASKTAANKIHTEILNASPEQRRNIQTGKRKQNIDAPAEAMIVGNEQTHVDIYPIGHRENMVIPPLKDTSIQYKDVRNVNTNYDSIGAADAQFDGFGAVNEHIGVSDLRPNSSPQTPVDIPPPPPI